MIRTMVVAALACWGICVGNALADECSEATNATKILGQKSDRAVDQAMARADRIKCCSAAYFQAQCEYQKFFLEQVRLQQQLLNNEGKACNRSAESIAISNKQHEDMIKQTQ